MVFQNIKENKTSLKPVEIEEVEIYSASE